ncbi:Uncharacterized protein Rs2_12243 [Raphanus sativus]|nr:Uncharacterized protein Rs2_12243 [Raphanus sativus]
MAVAAADGERIRDLSMNEVTDCNFGSFLFVYRLSRFSGTNTGDIDLDNGKQTWIVSLSMCYVLINLIVLDLVHIDILSDAAVFKLINVFLFQATHLLCGDDNVLDS